MVSQKDEDSSPSCEVSQEEPGSLVNVNPVLECPAVNTQEEASPCALSSTTEETLGQAEELKAQEEVQVVEEELVEITQKTQDNVEEEKWVEEVVNVESKSKVSQAQFEVCRALEPTAGVTSEDHCKEASASTVRQDSNPIELLETQPDKQLEHPQGGAEEQSEVPPEALVADDQRANEQHIQKDHPEIQEKIQMEDSIRSEEHSSDVQSPAPVINDQPPNGHLDDAGEEPSMLNQVTEEIQSPEELVDEGQKESKDGEVAIVSIEVAGESPDDIPFEEQKPADTEAQQALSVSVSSEDKLNQCSDRALDEAKQEVVEVNVAEVAVDKETITADSSQDPSVDTEEQQTDSASSEDATELETLTCVPGEKIGVQESHKEEAILEEPVKGAETDICPVEQSTPKEEVSSEGTPEQKALGETRVSGAVGLEEMDQSEKGDKPPAQPLEQAQSRESEERVAEEAASTTAEEDLDVPTIEEKKQDGEEPEVIRDGVQEVNEDQQKIEPHSEVTQLWFSE